MVPSVPAEHKDLMQLLQLDALAPTLALAANATAALPASLAQLPGPHGDGSLAMPGDAMAAVAASLAAGVCMRLCTRVSAASNACSDEIGCTATVFLMYVVSGRARWMCMFSSEHVHASMDLPARQMPHACSQQLSRTRA